MTDPSSKLMVIFIPSLEWLKSNVLVDILINFDCGAVRLKWVLYGTFLIRQVTSGWRPVPVPMCRTAEPGTRIKASESSDGVCWIRPEPGGISVITYMVYLATLFTEHSLPWNQKQKKSACRGTQHHGILYFVPRLWEKHYQHRVLMNAPIRWKIR